MTMILRLLLAVAVAAATCVLAQCTVLNECGLLGEKVYSGGAGSPETIVYRAQRVRFGNGVEFDGLRLAFQNDVNPSLPYLGVWRLPKGRSIHLRLVNQHASLPANIHLHGLHVKGTGQDDPTVQVQPGASHTYAISMGANHAGGTHWIHPHVHPSGVRSIGGCALGMIIVEDDAGNREVPEFIRTAPVFNLIIQRHQPKYWVPSNTSVSDFVTVNGIADNPILEIPQLKWTRLRALSVGVSFANLVNGRFVSQPGMICTFVVIAKDGVYLKTPRYLKGPNFPTIWNEASRIDLMVRCDGFVGDEVQFYFGDFRAFRIRLKARNEGVAPDLSNLDYSACLPKYLADTFQDPINYPPLFIGPTLRFTGFEQQNAIASYAVNSTIDVSLAGFAHPFHFHINHFQIAQDDSVGWYQRGDWHDTAENAVARLRLSSYTQTMLIHCHNVDHQDIWNTNGMMGTVWITGNDQPPTTTFQQDCPNVVVLQPTTFTPTTSQIRTSSPTKPTKRVTASPTRRPVTPRPTKKTKSPTQKPTKAPRTFKPTKAPTAKPTKSPKTSKPTRSPTMDLSCRSFKDTDMCVAHDRCYFIQPSEEELKQALRKLKPQAKKKCKNQIGCRSLEQGYLCKYNCIPVCKLDPRCRVVNNKKGAKKCKPLPAEKQ